MITIIVRDQRNGETLPGAHVLQLDQDGNRTGAGTTTDALGRATIQPGPYEITHVGYLHAFRYLAFAQDVLLEWAPVDLNEIEIFPPDRTEPETADPGEEEDQDQPEQDQPSGTGAAVAAGAGVLLLLLLLSDQ